MKKEIQLDQNGKRRFGMLDKVAYATGDFGCNMSFALKGTVQTFWLAYMFMETGLLSALLLLVQIWDAVNDPMIGSMIDRDRRNYKMGKYGKRQLNNDAKNSKTTKPANEWKDVFKTDNDNLIPTDEDIKIIAVQENELNKDKVVHAKEQIKEQKSKRGKWFSAVFFVVNLFVLAGVLLYQYNEFGVKDLDTFLVQDQNFKYLILAFAMFAVIMIMEAIRNYALLLKSTKTHRPFLAYKSAAIHRYYDNITPLATGGQAFELVYLKSRGVKSGVATSIPFSKYIVNQFVFVSLSIILLCFNGWVLDDGAKFTTILAVITLAVICCAVAFIIFLSVSKKFAPKLILSILKFAQKCKLVKDYNKTFEKIMRFVLEYQRCIKYYASSFWTLIAAFLTTVAIYVCKALIAFFIYCTFNGFNTAVFSTIFTKIILCELVVKLVPIPGGSGLSEISFTTAVNWGETISTYTNEITFT